MTNFGTWFLQRGGENRALTKLSLLADYPKGWAHGSGEPFPDKVCALARIILEYSEKLGIDRTNVFARRDGGLIVAAYVGQDVYDLTIHANGTFEWLHERDDVELETASITLSEIPDKVIEIARQRWSLFASWNQLTTTRTKGVLEVVPLLAQALIERIPRSTLIAPWLPQAAPVHT